MATGGDPSDTSAVTWTTCSVSDSPSPNPDVVPRRSRGELTDDERCKLEHQGVPRDCHHDDLSIMKARYGQDKDCNIVGVESGDSGKELTCEDVRKQITSLMNDTAKAEVIIHYIGHGKKKTGDWCFSDGFITLREILDLYMSNTHFKGRILSIVSDCSYSGSWVKECMEFMDEQGVGPCGHVAKEKGILVELYASCLSFETSVEMAFSAHCAKNDKNTGTLSFGLPASLSCAQQIHECQHPSGINSTQVGCKNKIDEPCTMAPGSTWQRWSAGTRVWLVTSNDNIQPEWSYVLFVDDEQTMCSLINKKIAENIEDCGQVLKSGWGEEPPSEVIEWIEKNYKVDYNYTS